MSPKLKILAILTPLLILIDQLTKIWTVRTLRYSGAPLSRHTKDALEWLGHDSANPDEIDVIPGFLSFVHAQNPGAAMGIGVGYEYRMYLFGAFTIVAVVVLANMYRQLPADDRFQSATIALILSGALGNAIDRLHKQTVTDFIRMYTEWEPLKNLLEKSPLRSGEWPTYNIADAAIVVGVVLYLLYYLVVLRDQEGAAGDPGRDPMKEDAGG